MTFYIACSHVVVMYFFQRKFLCQKIEVTHFNLERTGSDFVNVSA